MKLKYLWILINVVLPVSLVLAGGEQVKFIFHAPADAQTVHLGGTFNNWSTIANPMIDTDKDNCWESSVFLSYGRYEYRFLVNGKNWYRDPLNPMYGGSHSNSLVIVKNPIQPDIKLQSPANGTIIYDNKIEILAEFIPGSKNFDISRDSTVILYDSIRQNFIYHPQNRILECIITNCTEGEHWIRILARDQAGNTVEPVERMVIINNEDTQPIAHAGFTQITPCYQSVQLNAGLSFDADFDPITQFAWKLIKAPVGSNASMDNPSLPFPNFQPDQPGRYLFSLQIIAGGKKSVPDTTDVWSLALPSHLTHFAFDANKYSDSVKQISLVGEFNTWQANQTVLTDTDQDGRWATSIELAPGEYEYKFVINQDAWLPDPENPLTIADGWNGVNSIKRIENMAPEITNFDLQVQNSLVSIKPVANEEHPTNKFAWFQDIQNPALPAINKNPDQIFYFPRISGDFDLYLMSWNQPAVAPMKNLRLQIGTNNANLSLLDDSPRWCYDAIIYEIYVREFTPEGTLKGVLSKLPYLKKLGVNCIWLMPVFESPAGHGYAPSDFFKVNPAYGTMADLVTLVQTAHEQGFKVILDFIANHSGDQHPYFKSAYTNPHSAFRDFYIWYSDELLKDRLKYAYHNDWDQLPNLNFQNPQVWHFILTVAKYWMKFGIDGFRCDVAWGVPHPFWKTLRRELKKINPELLLLNEVLPRSPAYHQAEFDMSYDTDFYGNLLDVLQQKKPIASLNFGLHKAIKNYPSTAQSLRYLENHDMNRFISDFGPERTKLAATLLLTGPGTPMLYYGQELGQRTIREAMDWEMKNPEQISLLDFYKKLIRLRNQFSALRTGQLSPIELDVHHIYAYLRMDSLNQFLIVLNFSDKPARFALELNSKQANFKSVSKMKLIDLLDEKLPPMIYQTGDKLFQTMAAYESRIYRLLF